MLNLQMLAVLVVLVVLLVVVHLVVLAVLEVLEVLVGASLVSKAPVAAEVAMLANSSLSAAAALWAVVDTRALVAQALAILASQAPEPTMGPDISSKARASNSKALAVLVDPTTVAARVACRVAV